MKKLFKALTCLTVACTAIASVAAFTACNNDKPDNPDKDKQETKISYQCTGYTDTVRHSFSSFDFMGNLLSDGTGVIYRYEKTEELVETTVTWKVETDRDGLTQLTLDDKIEEPFEVYLDEETNTFELEYTFAFAGSYHRNVVLTVSSEIKYNTTAAFITAANERRAQLGEEEPDPTPEKTAIVTFNGGNGNSIEFYEDKTAKLSAFNGQMNFDYTWVLDGDVITMTSVNNPSEKMTSTKEGDTVKFVYSAAFLQGQSITFTCNDISALKGKTELVTFNGGDGNSIVFYSDKTAKLSAYGGKMNFDYTWTISDDVITMTSVNNPSETMTSAREGDTVKFVYSAAFLQGNSITFTCNDISALKQEVKI